MEHCAVVLEDWLDYILSDEAGGQPVGEHRLVDETLQCPGAYLGVLQQLVPSSLELAPKLVVLVLEAKVD